MLDPVRQSVHPVDHAVAVDHAADQVVQHFGPTGYIRAELWKGVRSMRLYYRYYLLTVCVNLKLLEES